MQCAHAVMGYSPEHLKTDALNDISNSIEAVILYHSPSTKMMENTHNNCTSETAKGFALSCAGNYDDGVDVRTNH
jgi:hypothetical protein